MTKPELALYAKEDGTGRAYKHPFRKLPATDKPVTSPSVTTILGLVDKPALIQWAATQTVEWAIENVSRLFTKTDDSIRTWGKYRWRDVRDERAEVGSGVHEYIEAEHTQSWKFPELDEEQKRIIQQWELLKQRYTITAHRSEFTVWSNMEYPEFSWAGTCDGLWDIVDNQTGEAWSNVFIDLKTSKNIWPEHWLQLSALRHAEVIMVKGKDGTWTEEPLPQGDGTAIIHLREDKYAVMVETDQTLLSLQYDQFMAYRRVWHTKHAVEDYVTARDKTEKLAFN